MDDPTTSFHQVHEDDGEPRNLQIEHFVVQIKETADKLLRDHANRGDVKLLSTALRSCVTASRCSRPITTAAR